VSRQNPTPAVLPHRFWKVLELCPVYRRPSWSHYPDDWSWRRASWGDRARAVAVVVGIVAVLLAGASSPA
jgi:hypothetical protein